MGDQLKPSERVYRSSLPTSDNDVSTMLLEGAMEPLHQVTQVSNAGRPLVDLVLLSVVAEHGNEADEFC